MSVGSTASAEFAAKQARHIVIVTVIVVALAITVMILMARVTALRDMSIVYLVFLFGTVGGIANNQLRLGKLVESDPATQIGPAENKLVTFQIYLSPVIGGVFAVVLYGIFFSESLITGDLFPRFGDCASEAYGGIAGLADCNPESNSEVAKAFVWAFAAGFMERLVPNLINGLQGTTGNGA
jgi:hypothetical protein